MDRGLFTGVVSIDLTKAFDTVDHGILYGKLKSAGFASTSVKRLQSYLTNRTQVTAIGNVYSSAKPVHIGLPQGSVLGPLLFIIYVNDLSSCIKYCKVSLYADDTVIYFSSSGVSVVEDKLNSDLARLGLWLKENLLTLTVLLFSVNCKAVTKTKSTYYPKLLSNRLKMEISKHSTNF